MMIGETKMAIRAGERSRTSFLLGQSARKAVGDTVTYIVLSSIAVVILIPIAWMFAVSVKSDSQLGLEEFLTFPFHFESYLHAWTFMPIQFTRFYLNSMLVTGTVIVGATVSCTLIAYGFARFRFPGRTILFIILLSTMMLPKHVTMIPLFVIFQRLGWIDTFKPLIIPDFFGHAFLIFLARQFFMTISRDFDDSARMEGCGPLQTLYYVLVPLIKPTVILMMLFSFMWSWGEFLDPLIYLNSMEKWTIALGLSGFNRQHHINPQMIMAMSLVATIPQIMVFFVGQKYFIKGIVVGAIKG